jgi:hypothetical protein
VSETDRERDEQEELPDYDFADPLKRDPEEDEELPGLDPAITLPPE